MKCPGQGARLWEDLLFSFIFGLLFFGMGHIFGLLTFLLSGETIICFLWIPLIVYLMGSIGLFVSVRLNPL